ncbi:dTDP-glucose 4,6-dehydratase [Candidatus Pelagibacter sp.]|nr:dTDP-glucose 4,6-dehydratase [Candidatus Pelagibacter sp.]
MHKVLVTGGLGFIGSNLIAMLLKQKYTVINIDKISYASNFYNAKVFSKNKKYKFIKCNIQNKKKIDLVLQKFKPNCIFNLAAETHVDRSIDGPKSFIDSNILGTFSLLESFRNYSNKFKKTKLIHVSTDEVYGDVIKGRSKEIDAYKPSSPYSASKAASDHLVYSYIRTFKIPAMITNCSNNYGPRQHPEKLIPKLIYNILKNKELPIYGKGTNSREWIYVDDHCDALIRIYKKGTIGEFYNIGSNYNLNNLAVVKKLLETAKNKIIIGKKVKISFVKDRPGHDLRYAIDSSKLKKKLKWKPKTNFKQGLEKTFLWYLQNQKYYSKLNKKDITSRIGFKK